MNTLARYIRIALGAYLKSPVIGPYSVQLGLSDACNYRCIMCNIFSAGSAGSYTSNGKTLMEFDTAKKLILSLSKIGTRTINFCGYGETLLFPRLKEIVAITKQAGLQAAITTNGQLLTRPMIDDLSALKLDELYISLNAATEKTYTRIHKGCKENDFPRIVEMAAYAQSKNIRVTVTFVIMSLNYREIDAFISAAKRLKIPEIIFRELGTRFLLDTSLALSVQEKELLKKHPCINEARIRHNLGQLIKTLDHEKKEGVDCFAGYVGGTIITADGSVFACCNCNTPVGNVYHNDFAEIWNNQAYRKFRHEGQLMHGRTRYPEGCLCATCPTHVLNARLQQILYPWRKTC